MRICSSSSRRLVFPKRVVVPCSTAILAVFCKALGIGILEGDTVHLESTDREILVRKPESVKTTASKRRGVAAPSPSECRIHNPRGVNSGGPTNMLTNAYVLIRPEVDI